MAVLLRCPMLCGLRVVSPLSTHCLTFSTHTFPSGHALESGRFQCSKVNQIQTGGHFDFQNFQPFNVTQTNTIHTGMVQRKKQKDVNKFKDEQFELVNVFTTKGTLLAEGVPMIFLDRLCSSFTCFQYTDLTDVSKNTSQDRRNLQLVKKTETLTEPSANKRLRRVKVVSKHEVKSIEKLQTMVVVDGQASVTLKPKEPSNKRLAALEHHVKNEMRQLCTFHFKEGDNITYQIYTLERAEEDDRFYKRLFTVVREREKDEIAMLKDYFETVKSFSSK